VRFFQRQGYDAEAVVSAGAIATTASWTVKTLLFLIAIPFAAGSFHAPSGSGTNQAAVWIILAVILAAGIAATLIAHAGLQCAQHVRPLGAVAIDAAAYGKSLTHAG
jgi:hypothetical protein